MEEAGTDFDHVVKTTCFLSDMNDFVPFNEVYKTVFTTEFPARSAVEVARLPRDVKVEIEVTGNQSLITIQRQKRQSGEQETVGHSVLFMGGENDRK